MNNLRDPFEEFLRSSLERHEVGYNPGHWEELEQKLDSGSTFAKKKFFQNSLILKSVAAMLLLAVVSYFSFDYFSQEASKAEPNKTLVTESKQPVSLKSPGTNSSITDKGEVHQEVPGSNSSLVISESKENELAHPFTTLPEKQENIAKKEDDIINNNLTELPSINKSPEAVANKPILVFNIDQARGCEELLTNFTVEHPDKNYSFIWEFGDGTMAEGSNTDHLYKGSGVYGVKLIATSKIDNSKHVNTIADAIFVDKNPKAEFEFTYSQLGAFQFETNFQDLSEGAVEWKWNFGDNKYSSEQAPKHIYQSKGTYSVELIVKNASGCSSIKRQFVEIKDNNLNAPNSFSPNGDGLNDFFIPKALEISDLPFEMFIYDFTGNMVYKTNDKGKPWNGKLSGSNDIYEVGSTFRWSVIIKDVTGMEQNYMGTVTIVKNN